MGKISEFMKDYKNRTLVRYVGFSMAFFGLAVGIAVSIVGMVLTHGGIGGAGAGLAIASFFLLPVVDLNFPRRGSW